MQLFLRAAGGGSEAGALLVHGLDANLDSVGFHSDFDWIPSVLRLQFEIQLKTVKNVKTTLIGNALILTLKKMFWHKG